MNIKGIKGLTIAQIQDEVAAGGSLCIFPGAFRLLSLRSVSAPLPFLSGQTKLLLSKACLYACQFSVWLVGHSLGIHIHPRLSLHKPERRQKCNG
jgi:hypothetical protein